MTLPSSYRFVQLDEADLDAVLRLDTWAFPTATTPDELAGTPFKLEWDRTVGVLHDEPDREGVPIDGAVPVRTRLAAMHSSYPFETFPVPGGALPVAGLTWVAVHPQDRRRGLLTAMIDRHLADCVRRGEAVSALFAAETAIYGRFGYGKAADDLRLRIPRGAQLRDVPGSSDLEVRLEDLDPTRHSDLVARVHRAAGTHPAQASGVNRPGWVTRETTRLREVFLSDAPALRSGRERKRIVVVESDGEPRGYAVLQRTLDWETTGPVGTVHAQEVVALDPAAAHRLWSTLLDLDLTTAVEPFMLPVDDVIMQLLVDPRGAAPRLADNVWLRIVDVPAALAGRRYACDVDLVVHVTDARLPANEGRWHLRATGFGPATVGRTDAAADLSLDVRELSAAYLGGVSLAALAAAGLVEEQTDLAVLRASTAFGWPVAPGSTWYF